MSTTAQYQEGDNFVGDNDYASRTGQSQIPVTKDESNVEDPIDPATADSDATLGKSIHLPHHWFPCSWPTRGNRNEDKKKVDS